MQGFRVEHRLFVKETEPRELPGETREQIRDLVARYPEGQQKSALLPALHLAQEASGGYLPAGVMDQVAALLGIQPIEVYEVATFYSMFFLEPTGKFVIEVCHTAPCAVCGGEELIRYLEEKLGIEAGGTTPDGLFTLRTVECLGGCGYAPVMQVNTEFHEQVSREKVDRIIQELRSGTYNPLSADSRWERKFF